MTANTAREAKEDVAVEIAETKEETIPSITLRKTQIILKTSLTNLVTVRWQM
jgi:hypothetical protein